MNELQETIYLPPTPLNPHGQPVNGALNFRRRVARDVSEVLGLTKGILSDGLIHDDEAKYLHAWGLEHPDAVRQWPVNLVFSRLTQIFADGVIDDTEREDLHELMASLIGGATSILLGYEGATTLPLDQPAPLICWGPGEVYVFTGKFAFGTRAHCEHEVYTRGGICEDNVTRRTTFLVLGTFASEDWRQTSYGRKIERAVELRDAGFAIRIVGEDHWANSLALTPRDPAPEQPF